MSVQGPFSTLIARDLRHLLAISMAGRDDFRFCTTHLGTSNGSLIPAYANIDGLDNVGVCDSCLLEGKDDEGSLCFVPSANAESIMIATQPSWQQRAKRFWRRRPPRRPSLLTMRWTLVRRSTMRWTLVGRHRMAMRRTLVRRFQHRPKLQRNRSPPTEFPSVVLEPNPQSRPTAVPPPLAAPKA